MFHHPLIKLIIAFSSQNKLMHTHHSPQNILSNHTSIFLIPTNSTPSFLVLLRIVSVKPLLLIKITFFSSTLGNVFLAVTQSLYSPIAIGLFQFTYNKHVFLLSYFFVKILKIHQKDYYR